MKPIVLFSIQFTMSLVLYSLLAAWYVVPRLRTLPRDVALQPLLWVHAFRVVGGTVLAPGSVGVGVPLLFQRLVGIGDMVTAALAVVALVAVRRRWLRAPELVWLLLVVATVDTVDAIIWSVRDNVFVHPLGLNWVIVTIYVPALLVSSALILWQLRRPRPVPEEAAAGIAAT